MRTSSSWTETPTAENASCFWSAMTSAMSLKLSTPSLLTSPLSEVGRPAASITFTLGRQSLSSKPEVKLFRRSPVRPAGFESMPWTRPYRISSQLVRVWAANASEALPLLVNEPFQK